MSEQKKRGPQCVERIPEPVGVVIFGASGDLTERKLLPALFNLFCNGLLPKRFYLVGTGRTDYSDDDFRETVRKAIDEHGGSECEEFVRRSYYHRLDYSDAASYDALAARLDELCKEYETTHRLYHLATPPGIYAKIAAHLSDAGLLREGDAGYRRVIFEKPFGSDLESARALDDALHANMREEQIFRIDHYLGKETVQNILMLRFANIIFEPLWSRQYIEHVQINVLETLGVENRASYFDQSGLLRDMFQNHIIQLVALVAMESPFSFAFDNLRDEKVKLMRAIRPFSIDALDENIIRGRYSAGTVGGEAVKGYAEEDGVAKDSTTETYIAAKMFVDNWRWKDVPFYLRAGKRLAKKTSSIIITFKDVPYSLFAAEGVDGLSPNVLRMTIQPDEGVSLSIEAKHPGGKLCLSEVALDFKYKDEFGVPIPEAYERLLLDAMLGDLSLFWRSDGVERAWEIFTPVLKQWGKAGSSARCYPYEAGSFGPKEADALLEFQGHRWARP